MITVEHLIEPVIALMAVAGLIVAARWASLPARSLPSGVVFDLDFGLLVPVVVVDTEIEVSLAQAALRAQGIRSTWALALVPLHIDAAGNIVSRPRRRRHVLVFAADADRAAHALAGA